MSTITIQPGQSEANGGLPYPLHVDSETGDIGRQDFWQGQMSRVIGFQQGDEQRIVLHWDEITEDPQKAVGLVVVAVDSRGDIFQFGGPITSVVVREDAVQ